MHASKQLRGEGAATTGPLPGEKPPITNCRLGRLFPAVSPAATLALAGVFALASVVPGLAAALALTGVLALTSVLFFDLLVVLLVFPLILALLLGAEGCLQRDRKSVVLGRSVD